jgi:hypothetical protein
MVVMLEIIVQFYDQGGNNTQDAERGSRNDEAGNPEGTSFATQQLSKPCMVRARVSVLYCTNQMFQSSNN